MAFYTRCNLLCVLMSFLICSTSAGQDPVALPVAMVQSPEENASHPDVYAELAELRACIDELTHQQQHRAHSSPLPKRKFPTVGVGGFFQTDVGYITQDAASRAAVGDLQDGSDFRRARIGVKGQAWCATSYNLQVDFASLNRVVFTDVWMQMKRDWGNVRIGRFRQPFGMEAMSGVTDLAFIEYANTFGFYPFRQTGIGAFGTMDEDAGTWFLSGFRAESDGIGASVGDDGGWGLAGRLTFLPYDCESTAQLLHVGFDYALIAPPDDTVRFGAIPEAFLAEEGVGRIPNFVDTGIITAENVNQFGVEGAFQNGRLHGQSELFVTIVDQIGGGNSYFHGAYSQVGYSLTGEARPYDRKSGTFGRPNPHHALDCGGLGAWEMAARWSWVDLNDGAINGGELTTLTAGLNCYLNPQLKFQFNYVNAMHDTGPIDTMSHFYIARAQLVY